MPDDAGNHCQTFYNADCLCNTRRIATTKLFFATGNRMFGATDRTVGRQYRKTKKPIYIFRFEKIYMGCCQIRRMERLPLRTKTRHHYLLDGSSKICSHYAGLGPL